MEWSWKMKNGVIDVTPFLLFESSADSDDAVADDVLRHHHRQEKYEDKEEKAKFDDVESCSYDDHSCHVKGDTTHDNHHQVHEYDDGHDHGHGYDDNGEDVDDDDDDDNWGESKMIDQEKRCRELCVDSSNLDDRQFWETCLGS